MPRESDMCEDCGGAYPADYFETRHTCMPDVIRDRERARIVAAFRKQGAGAHTPRRDRMNRLADWIEKGCPDD